MATSFSMWLGIIALKHKLGDDDQDIQIVEQWAKDHVTNHKMTDECAEAVERIRAKIEAREQLKKLELTAHKEKLK